MQTWPTPFDHPSTALSAGSQPRSLDARPGSRRSQMMLELTDLAAQRMQPRRVQSKCAGMHFIGVMGVAGDAVAS